MWLPVGEIKMHMHTHARCDPELANMRPANKASLRDACTFEEQLRIPFPWEKKNWPAPSESTKEGREGEAREMCEAQDVHRTNHEVG